jgi:hypothetical protein
MNAARTLRDMLKILLKPTFPVCGATNPLYAASPVSDMCRSTASLVCDLPSMQYVDPGSPDTNNFPIQLKLSIPASAVRTGSIGSRWQRLTVRIRGLMLHLYSLWSANPVGDAMLLYIL